MNDFLQSLRGGQKDKRTPKTRRGFDNGNSYNSSQGFNSHVPYQGSRGGNNNIKRPVTRASAHNHTSMESQPSFSSPDLAESINSFVDVFSKTQKELIDVHERRIIAEERKAIALEEIAEYLRVITMPSNRDESDGYDNECLDDNSFNEPDLDIKAESSRYQTAHTGTELKSYREDDRDEIELTVELDVDDSDSFNLGPVDVMKKRGSQQPHGRKKNQRAGTLQADVEEKPFENSVVGNRAIKADNDSADLGKEEIKVITRKKAEKIEKSENEEKKSEQPQGILSRDEVMKIVYDMRANGKTFDDVAQHLAALGQPTFSGRGEWHAQTVHRLCNKRKK